MPLSAGRVFTAGILLLAMLMGASAAPYAPHADVQRRELSFMHGGRRLQGGRNIRRNVRKARRSLPYGGLGLAAAAGAAGTAAVAATGAAVYAANNG